MQIGTINQLTKIIQVEPLDYSHTWYEDFKPNFKDYDQDSDYWAMHYYDRWTILIGFFPEFQDQVFPPISILDVGCGLGRALDYYKKCGAIVLGVEPSDYAIENSRLKKEELIHDYFLDTKIDGKFDVVHFEQVLSHMRDPKEALIKAHGLLKENGILVVEEPNEENPLQKILARQHGKYWITRDHENYWNFESMERLLNEAGFQTVKKTGTFPMEMFELMGDYYIGSEIKGKEVHLKRTKFMESLGYDLRQKLLDKFTELGIGRDLIFFARLA